MNRKFPDFPDFSRLNQIPGLLDTLLTELDISKQFLNIFFKVKYMYFSTIILPNKHSNF